MGVRINIMENYEDFKLHENHELTIIEVKGIGLVLRCLDCNMNMLLCNEEKDLNSRITK
jgi:hypothetical protein